MNGLRARETTTSQLALILFFIVVVGCSVAVSGFAAAADGPEDAGAADNIHPAVATAGETQTVLVYFTDPDDQDAVERQTAVSVETLQTRAQTDQEPLRQYATNTAGVTIERQFWLGNIAVVTIDHDQAAVTELAAVAGVEQIGPNMQVEAVSSAAVGAEPPTRDTATPAHIPGHSARVSDTMSETTYGLEQINAPAVWSQYDTRGADTSVAVLDTGVDAAHPDITLSKWGEWDADGRALESDPYDPQGHGTHVSGTVAGGSASGTHVGVAPDSELYHGKVFADDGSATGAQVLAGMQWAVANDADVMSLSLGATGYVDGFIAPVRDAEAAGTMVVAAIGNSGEGSSVSPGNVYDTVSVGASDSQRDIATFSGGEVVERGDWTDPPADWPDAYIVPTVAAPGVSVLSTYPDGEYQRLQGTSMATPHVASAAALVQSATDEELSLDTIRAALSETAVTPAGVDPAQDTRYGHGIIDVQAAVESLVDTDPAFLTVEITETNSPVTAGETVDVTAEIANQGDDPATQDITLEIDGGVGEVAVAEDQTFAGGATEELTLSWTTETDDAGEYQATVASADAADTTAVTVEKPLVEGFFEVSDVAAPETVATGERFNVSALVSNTGDLAAEQDVTLSIDGVVTDTAVVSLDGGTDTRVVFPNVSIATVDEYTLTIASDDDTATTTVTVEAESVDTTVSISDQTQPYVDGHTTATVDNASTDRPFMIVVYDDTSKVIGNSEAFKAGETVADVSIELDEEVTRRQNITVMLHDTDGDEEFGAPIESDGSTVEDTAFLTIDGPTIRNAPARDLNGDGLFEDIEGSGKLTIFDVQALFTERNSEVVETNARLFSFDGQNPDQVTVFDIQRLFNQLQNRK